MKKAILIIVLLLMMALPVRALAQNIPSNGKYTVEVMLGGGSGRASVASPAKLDVEGGKMMATIVWSSPNYTYMEIDGVRYDSVNTKGNSTFEIPVAVLDADIAVSAETIAMSEPHVIEYVLHFDSSTLKPGNTGMQLSVPAIIVIVAVIAIVARMLAVVFRRNNAASSNTDS